MRAVRPNQESQIRLHLNTTFSPSDIRVISGIFLRYVRLIFIENISSLSNSSAVFVSLSKLCVDGLNTGICLLGKLWSCRLTTLNYLVSCKLYSSQLLIHFVPKLLQSSSSFANLDKVMFLSFFFTGMSQALATQCLIVFRHPILCVLRCIELQKLLIMAKKIV